MNRFNMTEWFSQQRRKLYHDLTGIDESNLERYEQLRGRLDAFTDAFYAHEKMNVLEFRAHLHDTFKCCDSLATLDSDAYAVGYRRAVKQIIGMLGD